MQTYKLINNTTKEETICSLVTIDGFEYYVGDDKILNDEPYISLETNYAEEPKERYVLYYLGVGLNGKNPKKVIATNNPNIDIPKVIDELDSLVEKDMENNYPSYPAVFRRGYSKAKETYQFTKEDIFGLKDLLQNTSPLMFEVVTRNYIRNLKETKTIYYE